MHIKIGLESEDTGIFLRCQIRYSKSLSWTENLNKLFIVLGGEFKFSVQDRDLAYLIWQCKNSLISSDLKPTLIEWHLQSTMKIIEKKKNSIDNWVII